MSIIHNLVARFRADTGAFDRNVKKSRTHMTRFGKEVKTMGRQMVRLAVAGGGIYALQRGLRGIVKAASDAQETQAKFNTVFKNLSGEANKWAVSFGKSVGRSEQSVKSWMARLQDTFVPLGIARDEAMKLSQSLVGLAVDVASFNNAADADVIRDFTSALVGNHETVRKFGIIISEAAITQEAFVQGMNKTYKQLTDLEKVQLRYSLIQKGSTDAQGDALRTADSFANQIKRLHANLEDMRKELGGPFMNSLNTIITAVNKSSEAWAKFFKTQAEGWAEILSGFESIRDILRILNEMKKTKPIKPLSQDDYNMWIAGGPAATTKDGGRIPVKPMTPKDWQYVAERNARLRREKMVTEGIDQFMTADFTESVTSVVKETEEAAKKIARSVDTIGDHWFRAANRVRSSMGDMFDTMMTDVHDTEDAFIQFAKNIMRSMRMAISDIISQWVMYQTFTKFGMTALAGRIGDPFAKVPATEAHSGGIVGSIATKRNVPALAFAGAPRLHGGLAGDEYPAILQRGEQVVPRGGGMSAPTIIINNNTGQKMRQDGQPFFDGNRWVLNIVAEGINRDMTFRKLIASTK